MATVVTFFEWPRIQFNLQEAAAKTESVLRASSVAVTRWTRAPEAISEYNTHIFKRTIKNKVGR